MKIDAHCHIYPDQYLDQIEKMSDIIQVTKLPDGRAIMKDRSGNTLGGYKRVKPEALIADMGKMGVDMQILSLPNPNVYFADDKTNLLLARISNDYLSAVCKKYPDKFMCFACVPLNNVPDSIEELRRAINVLKMNGLALGTNISGKPLDSAGFQPFFDEVDKMGLPVSMHPMSPVAAGAMTDYSLTPILGFPFETTIAAARMICSGMLERYRNIKWILSHMGGTLPFLIGRIDWGYKNMPDCGKQISKPPSEYFKQLYFDTAMSTYHKPALKCAFETIQIEHIVLGSDYPFDTANISALEALDLSSKDKEKVYNGNIRKILKNLSQ